MQTILFIGGLQGVLDQLYTSMLPMCGQLIGVGQAIAGLAALTYIGIRVARHIAAAEPVDVFLLLRPFAIGLVIVLYPAFIGVLNGVLSPTVSGTSAMMTDANAAITRLLQQKEDALKSSAQLYNGAVIGSSVGAEIDGAAANSGNGAAAGSAGGNSSGLSAGFGFILSQGFFNLKNLIKIWLSEVLQLIYEAAALCINTIRTFQLIVLAILGPLVLGLSVFDTFRSSLNAWLVRYVRVFLWLPVANIFGAILATIQVQMLQLDLQGGGFSATDVGYMVFLIIGIIGYLTVPSVAGYIVEAGGGDALLRKVSAGAAMVAGGVVSAGKAAVGGVFGVASGGRSAGGSGWRSGGRGGSSGGSGSRGGFGRSGGASGNTGGGGLRNKISGN